MHIVLKGRNILIHEATFAEERGESPQPQEERNRQNRRQCARECGAPCQPCKRSAPDTISEQNELCTQRINTYRKKSYRICKVAVYVYICSSNGGLLLSRTRFEGLCHCGVVSRGRLGDERGSTRGNTQKRQRYTNACVGRARGEGGGAGPRPAAPTRYHYHGTIRGVGVDTASTYTLQSARRVVGTSRPLLNRNTHTVDEQRCIVRVECGPSYRFAYLLLPLQHVRHRDVFGKVHLAVEHDALAEDRRDVNSILVVLMAGHCHTV